MKAGSGTLYLTSPNSYSGGTTIEAGVLKFVANALGTGSIAIAGGTLQWASGNTQDISKSIGLLGPGIVAALDTNGNNIAFSGGLAGSGGLTKFGAGNLTLNAFAFYSGITTINAGSIILGNQNGLGSGPVVVNVSNGVSFASGLANAYFGSLGGPGSLVLTTAGNTAIALAVGQDNVSTTYSGQLSGKGSLTKSGSGALLLAASNAYSGTTAINQGELLVNGSLASAVTVNSGGTLGGMGHLSSVTVESGGLLAPGGATPQMSLGGTLTLLSSAVMDYQLDTPSDSDMVYMPSGRLALNDQQFADFYFTPLGGFGEGAYTLIDAGSITGNLGTSTSGTINGLPAYIATQGDSLVLTVVPEPSTLAILLTAAVGAAGRAARTSRPKRRQ